MDEKSKALFITSLRKNGLEATAAREARVSVAKVRRECDEDPAFAEEVDDALAIFADTLEAEAYRRAVTGVEKPVFHRGELVDHVLEYSDSLLAKMLTARRPETYGDKRQITGANNEPLKIIIQEFDFL